jgi:hypothetical protein
VTLPLTPSAASSLVDPDLPAACAARFVTPRLLTDPAFLARFDPRAISSTLALVWVAVDRRAAYVLDGDEVDTVHAAAGIGVCQAAGRIVTDLDGGPVGDPARPARGRRQGDTRHVAATARQGTDRHRITGNPAAGRVHRREHAGPHTSRSADQCRADEHSTDRRSLLAAKQCTVIECLHVDDVRQ